MKIFGWRERPSAEVVEEEVSQEAQLVVELGGKILVTHQDLRFAPRVLSQSYGHWLRVLDMSHNKIRCLRFLRDLSVLDTLVLDHNLVTSSSFFPPLPQLRVLWLNYNLIADVGRFAPRLSRACPALEHLSLMGNVAAAHFVTGGTPQQQEEYRHYVIGQLENLRHLDDRAVTPLERLRSFPADTSLIDDLVTLARDLKDSFTSTRTCDNAIV